MNRAEVEKKYQKMGLETLHAQDEAGKHYELHSHHATWLYYLKGSVKVKIGNQNWRTVGPNEEVVIKEGQLHEAVVGPEGAEYIFAYPANAEPFSYEPEKP